MATKLVNGIRYEMTDVELTTFNQRRAKTFEEAIEEVRAERNQLLAETDWTVLPDSPLSDSDKTAWETYRTDLRDLTDGLTTVDEVKAVVFPTKP